MPQASNLVLVVDDAPMIRALVRGLLEPQGFTILEAQDGEEALDMHEHHEIFLSIIDIFLPGKGGLQVIRELTDTRPERLIIAISGGETFDPDAILKLTESLPIAATFAKPLDGEALLAKVQSLANG